LRLFAEEVLVEPVNKSERLTKQFHAFFMAGNIHIGNIICEQLKQEGRKKIWLAKRVGLTESALCKILKKEYINTDLLLRISHACKHDFAAHISNFYQKHVNP
jgi:hypothetical protein